MDSTKLKNRLEGKVQEIHKPEEAVSETALTATDSEYLALSSNALDVIRSNLKISRFPLICLIL